MRGARPCPVPLVALLVGLGALAAACAPQETRRVENVVLICLDTVRYDTFRLVRDFHRDAAADPSTRRWEQATLLTQVQSSAPWTLPSVGSVFTGLHPNQHGAGSFPGRIANLTRRFPVGMREGVPTLATLLAERGFETVGFIAHSWLHFGLQQGFASVHKERPIAEDVIEGLATWLGQRGPEPSRFFAYLHFMDAHRPMHLGPRQLAASGESNPELGRLAAAAQPEACGDPNTLGCWRYLGYVRAVDRLHRAVAEVLDALASRGLLETTAVVVFADHGEEFGDHRDEEQRRALDPRETYGLGHGHSLYQEQLHVPLAIWHPSLPPGEVGVRASLVDVTPTLLGWLGVETRASFSGIDLGPVLAGREPAPDRPLYSSAVAFGPEREAVVVGERKRISDGGSGAGPLLFDLRRDPRERVPQTDAGTDLDALLAEYRARQMRAGDPAQPTPAELEGLQALGYLTDAPAR